MSFRSKKDFIRQNRGLPPEELSRQTGLSDRQIRKIREQFAVEATSDLAGQTHMSFLKNIWLLALVPAALTFLFYLPVLSNSFVNWDDTEGLVQNLHVRHLDGEFLHWMFTTFQTGNWMPLTWLSFALDYKLGQLNPMVYHLDNLLLHALNTFFVLFLSLRILKLATRSEDQRSGAIFGAFLTAVLFGLHPIHVESVAWATERKDVLCGVFFLSSLLAYLKYAASFKPSKYYLCLGLFVLALMSKPMAVTLPVVLLILDIWPLRRWSGDRVRVLTEKIPFFTLSILSGWITIEAQAQSSAFMAMEKLSTGFRLMNAFHSIIFYILKIIVPLDLAAYYPLPFGQRVTAPDYWASAALVGLLSWACFYYRRERPYLMASWSFYLITLAPVLGILQVGSQAAADRYAYLPSLGILMLFSAGLSKFLERQRSVMLGVLSVLILSLGYLTIQQLHAWSDSIALWEKVVKVSPRVSEVAYGNLANAYRDAHRSEQALRAYDEAIAIGPPHAYPHDGKGTVLLELGRTQEAAAEFKTAAALDPHYASPHRNLWFAYERLGMHREALAEAQEAVRIDPNFAEAFSNLGISYGSAGQYEKSMEAFKKALLIDPGNAQYLVNLATTCQRAGKYDEAIDLYKKVISQDSRQPVYLLNLGNTYLLKGMFVEAVETLEQAVSLQPKNPAIYQKLSEAYKKSGQLAKAKECDMKIRAMRAIK